MRDQALSVLLIWVFCLCVCCDRAQGGEPLRSPCLCGATNWSRVSAGGFSALMPMRPNSSVKTNHTEAGPAVVRTLKTQVSSAVTFAILHHSFPANSLETDRGQSFVRGLKATLGADGRLRSESVVRLGRYPGRQWRIEKSQGQTIITMRSYVVGDTLYQAVCVMAKDKVCQRHVAEFLDSCRLRIQ